MQQPNALGPPLQRHCLVFAVLVAGAFTRCLLSVPVNAWSWGCALPRTGVRGASPSTGGAGCFVVIPRLLSASGLRAARRLEAGLAGRWAPDLGGDCNDDGGVGTDTASDRKPRRWRSATNSTFRSGSGYGNWRPPAHTSDWSRPWTRMSWGNSSPMNTILLTRGSPSAQAGPRSLPMSWCTP